jgi:Fic family protein
MTEINEKTRDSIIAGIHDLLDKLREDQKKLNDRIKQLENDLITLGDKPSKKGKRRKYGENKRVVEDFLKNNLENPYNVADIAKSVDLPRSSVRATLMSLKRDGYVEELTDGMWKHK